MGKVDRARNPSKESTFSGTSTCAPGDEDMLTFESLSECESSHESAEIVACLLDWDDTLFPTQYIKAVVELCMAGASSLSPESPFYEPLRQHGELVEEVLRAARALGRVAIVTLSQRGWVLDSAAKFLPGLNLPRLLAELDIPIYYAAEHVLRSVARLGRRPKAAMEMLAEGIDVQRWCKQAAMEKCLRRMCSRQQVSLNVISIGDSDVEHEAIKAAMWSPARARLPVLEHLCKTIKMAEEPSLLEVGCQLQSLKKWLPQIVERRSDFDIDLLAV